MFLTAADLVALTERTRSAAQRRALERMGIAYLVDPATGRPRVLRSLVEKMLGGGATLAAREPQLRL